MFAFVVAGEDGRFVAARDPVGIKPLYWAQQRTAACASPVGDARLRRRLAAVRRAVPARLRVDAGGRARALRERGARRPGRRRPAPEMHVARHARGARSTPSSASSWATCRSASSSPAAWTRASSRRSPRRCSPSAASTLQTFAVGTPELARPRRRAPRRRAHRLRAPRDDVHRRGRARRRCPTSCARSSPSTPASCAAPCRTSCSPAITAQHVKVVLTGEGADELFAGYEYLRDFTEPDALHAELVRTVERPAQPQPPALRPRDDGPRPRGARAVPRPRGHRVGAAPAARGEARRAGRPGEEAPARGVRRLAARRPAVARQGRVRRRQRRARRAERGDRGRRSPTRSSRPSAARSTPPLRTKEELAYYRIFREHLAGRARRGGDQPLRAAPRGASSRG